MSEEKLLKELAKFIGRLDIKQRLTERELRADDYDKRVDYVKHKMAQEIGEKLLKEDMIKFEKMTTDDYGEELTMTLKVLHPKFRFYDLT